ncbi:MAG: sensor histidine kinase [Hyphomicrobiaceae bacterium]
MLVRRLYLQIYLTIVASLITVVVLTGFLWWAFARDRFEQNGLDVVGRLVQLSLPAATAPPDKQQEALDRLGRELRIDVTLFDKSRNLVAFHGEAHRAPPKHADRGGWHRTRFGAGWVLRLPDQRWLSVDLGRRRSGRPLLGLLTFLATMALGVGLAALPFARRLTRRLERLQTGVRRIGMGDLATRVNVEGRDEVASLASSFNEAAEKIEKLVDSQRTLLANASHELRTPLSRIRLGIEMMASDPNEDRLAALRGDIAELDALIDEILLMSRLDASPHVRLTETVDVVALVAEECAQFPDCHMSGSAPEMIGDRKLLQRLVRNLLDNAVKHGAPPVDVTLSADTNIITLTVLDAGEGIAAHHGDKIFQPFYRAQDKQNVSGYGLGLPLVQQIAELHDGSVTVLPGDGNGAAIAVRLAIRPDEDADRSNLA